MLLICCFRCFGLFAHFVFLSRSFEAVLVCGVESMKQRGQHNRKIILFMTYYYEFRENFVSVFFSSIGGLCRIVFSIIIYI